MGANTTTKTKLLIAIAILLIGLVAWLLPGSSSEPINFSTQVKPILNKNCISCHGGVRQNGGFSVMTREHALAPTDAKEPAIIPFHSDKSEIMRRLQSHDPEYRMPYEAEPLSEAEIGILKQWIDEGASWGLHWAYQPVEKIEIPEVETPEFARLDGEKQVSWAKNGIDPFILRKMQEVKLSPNREESKEILLRRLSLDLTGLPAPEHLQEQFLNQENSISYEELVDSLLNDVAYGEHWASMWLDLARYADSRGYEADRNRRIWEYRDYVIRALNEDLPYDQFLTEQLAGDLLPNPTRAQYIATGFHRNTPTNDEGGTDNEEYRTVAVMDRVNTTWEAIMGSTFACVQCHGHPYDPIPHEEYYEFMAFFNNTRDNDTWDDYPWLKDFSEVEEEKLKTLKDWVKKIDSPERATEINTLIKTWQPVRYSLEADSLTRADLYSAAFLGFRNRGWARFKGVELSGKEQLLLRAFTSEDKGILRIHLDSLEGKKLLEKEFPNTKNKHQFFEIPLVKTEGVHDLYLYFENPKLASNPDRRGIQLDWLRFEKEFPGKGSPQYIANKQKYWELMEANPAHDLIMFENPPEQKRKTYVFDRGNWSVHLEEVSADVPEILPGFPEDAPKNRLGLAQWITADNNPLTARTFVNRLWEQLFGKGLVETLGDFGTQGITPTHPELLDYLAWQFMHEYQWSIKTMLKELVLSATYRQSNKRDAYKLEKDPLNQYYTSGPRFRLSAEQIRDQALAVSGLLSPKMYGPPVMPQQPEDLWNAPYNGEKWTLSEGEDKYRRAVYTFLKRSAPYPSFETFDVESRQICNAQRIRTNTPLQALITLNDPVYLEAAQHLAQRMQKEPELAQQIKRGYVLAIGREIEDEKLKVLQQLYQESLQGFHVNSESAAQFLSFWEDPGEVEASAALSMVAQAIMNLDEFLTK